MTTPEPVNHRPLESACDIGAGHSRLDAILPELYAELHRQASQSIANERPDHTLVPTALVHETYLRMRRTGRLGWNDRDHFLALSARIMRHILVNHARDRQRDKRQGSAVREPLRDSLLVYEERAIDIVALDEALEELEGFDEVQARIVELRFFGGFTMREIAAQIDRSLRTTERELALARAWLRRRISGAESDQGQRT